jgi:WD40 repeat protein
VSDFLLLLLSLTRSILNSNSIFRPITAMKWLPTDSHPVQGFTSNKLIISTEDGTLLCLDCNGKLFAALKIETLPTLPPTSPSSTSIASLDCDHRMIVCGCQDGSLRVYLMKGGSFQMIQSYSRAHSGAVSAVSIGRPIEDMSLNSNTSIAGNNSSSSGSGASELLVSGSDDCSIRIWRLWYE